MHRSRLATPNNHIRTCPSDLKVDQLHLGELQWGEKRRLVQHLTGCSRCRQRHESARDGFRAIPMLIPDRVIDRLHQHLGQRPMPPELQRALARRSSNRLAAVVGRLKSLLSFGESPLRRHNTLQFAAAAAVATLAVAVGMERLLNFVDSPPDESPDESTLSGGKPATDVGPATYLVRTKGTVGLRIYRQRGDEVEEVLSGDDFRAGDRLRFRVSSPRAGQLMIVGVERSGKLYPAIARGVAARSMAVDEGSDELLSQAIELDDSWGTEWLFAVFCPTPFALSELKVGPTNADLRLPPGCLAVAFELVKR